MSKILNFFGLIRKIDVLTYSVIEATEIMRIANEKSESIDELCIEHKKSLAILNFGHLIYSK